MYYCFSFKNTSKVNLIQHYVIKFVSDLSQVCGFLRVLRFPPPIKLNSTIFEILLKVALSTIKPTNQSKVLNEFSKSRMNTDQ